MDNKDNPDTPKGYELPTKLRHKIDRDLRAKIEDLREYDRYLASKDSDEDASETLIEVGQRKDKAIDEIVDEITKEDAEAGTVARAFVDLYWAQNSVEGRGRGVGRDVLDEKGQQAYDVVVTAHNIRPVPIHGDN